MTAGHPPTCSMWIEMKASRSAIYQRMLGFQGPAQPSPALGDALNAGYHYLEVRCLGCDTHQTVALNIVRRPRRHRSTNWNATCAAKTARRSGLCVQAQSSGAVIWSRCDRPRFRPTTRRQHGGRANDELSRCAISTMPTSGLCRPFAQNCLWLR
jgi:hypothetical protein